MPSLTSLHEFYGQCETQIADGVGDLGEFSQFARFSGLRNNCIKMGTNWCFGKRKAQGCETGKLKSVDGVGRERKKREKEREKERELLLLLLSKGLLPHQRYYLNPIQYICGS